MCVDSVGRFSRWRREKMKNISRQRVNNFQTEKVAEMIKNGKRRNKLLNSTFRSFDECVMIRTFGVFHWNRSIYIRRFVRSARGASVVSMFILYFVQMCGSFQIEWKFIQMIQMSILPAIQAAFHWNGGSSDSLSRARVCACVCIVAWIARRMFSVVTFAKAAKLQPEH